MTDVAIAQAAHAGQGAHVGMPAGLRLTLLDLHGALVDAARTLQWAGVELLGWTDVAEVERAPGTAFVSPANSLGFMDGGIDYVLSRVMFPGLEGRVKAAIRAAGHTTLLGRPYLPIGRAVSVATPQREDVRLIAAPTMWLPQDVRGTHNAYHAMYAVLAEAARLAAAGAALRRVVLCGLGTGCGMLAPVEAVAQMRAAHEDFCAGRPPRWDAAAIAAEQPDVYMNTEFKAIAPGAVRHVA